jgi:Arylsulfotransferase (ASST)
MFSFAGGLCVEHFKVFPYALIHDASTAFEAIFFGQQKEVDGPLSYKRTVTAPETSWLSKSADHNDEWILMIAGSIAFDNLNPDGALAQLVDRDGQVRHQWNSDPELWSELTRVTRVPGVSGPIGPTALHLYDNGEILVSYHGYNTFPYAVGLAKFDKDSKLLWKRENFCHHCFSVTDDGRIFVPSLEIVDSPIMIGETAGAIRSPTNSIYRDSILELNADGEELSRLDVFDTLINSGWGGQLIRGNILSVETDDPLHLNDVRIIGNDLAAKHDWLSPNDLLISLRNLNSLAILDFHAANIKWISNGAVIGQHSPRVVDDGILTLDNLGGNQELGGTRLVKIDLERGIPSTVFPQRSEDLPDSMRTINSGYLDVSSDGKRVLVAVTHAGTIWEVDIASGRVLWEFIAGTASAGNARLKVNFAKYVSQPSFLLQNSSQLDSQPRK